MYHAVSPQGVGRTSREPRKPRSSVACINDIHRFLSLHAQVGSPLIMPTSKRLIGYKRKKGAHRTSSTSRVMPNNGQRRGRASSATSANSGGEGEWSTFADEKTDDQQGVDPYAEDGGQYENSLLHRLGGSWARWVRDHPDFAAEKEDKRLRRMDLANIKETSASRNAGASLVLTAQRLGI